MCLIAAFRENRGAATPRRSGRAAPFCRALRAAVGWIAAIALMPSIAAAASTGPPAVRRQVPSVRAAAPPEIDGVLNDACWSSASTFTDFVLMDQRKPLPFATTGYVCYDDAYLYAAVRGDDSEPAKIVAQETKRNGRIWNDDVLEVAIDPRGQFQDYFWFALNPIGTQYESIPGGTSANITWRGDWRGAAKRTETGWAAEFAIPWKMLRPAGGTKTMGVFFARQVARFSDWATSPDLGARFDARQMAEWTGLDIPEFGYPPTFMMYEQLEVVTGESGASDRRWLLRQPQLGLDIKQQTPRGHNWLVTLNPDFRNIEGAVEGVDFTYTERYIADRRPFFTEGSGYFPGSGVFHSTRIQDVEVAAKAYAPALGRLRYAALMTLGAEGHRNGVWGLTYRLQDKPSRRVYFNHIYHGEPGVENHVFETGGSAERIGKGGRGFLSGHFAASTTAGADGDGTRGSVGLGYSADPGRFSYGVSWGRIGRYYNPMIGYTPEKDYWSANAYANLYSRYPKGLIEASGLYLGTDVRRRPNGDRFADGQSVSYWADLRPSTWFSVSGGRSYRVPYEDASVNFTFGWGRRNIHRNGGLYGGFGPANGGQRVRGGIWSSFRPWKDFGLSLDLGHSRINYPLERGEPDYRRTQLILSLNYDISPERGLGGRLVVNGPEPGDLFGHEGKSNVYFTYRQAVRRGIDAYVIVGDPNADQWKSRFAFKLLTPF